MNNGTKLKRLLGTQERRGVVVAVKKDTLEISTGGQVIPYPVQLGLVAGDEVLIDGMGRLRRAVSPNSIYSV